MNRLSHVEEIELTRILRNNPIGSPRYKRALDSLVTHNLGLVRKVANKFPLRNATCAYDDLFQEGVAGLIHGIQKFEAERGYRLSTYVYRWIAAYVRRYYQNHGKTIRIPVHLSDKQMRLNKQLEALSTEFGNIAEDNATVLEAKELAASMTQSVSLNAHVGDDSELGDLVAFTDESADDRMDCDILLSRVQEHVSPRDYDILVKRYGLQGNAPHTLSELSEVFGLTRARIHQIEGTVLNTIKQVVGV